MKRTSLVLGLIISVATLLLTGCSDHASQVAPQTADHSQRYEEEQQQVGKDLGVTAPQAADASRFSVKAGSPQLSDANLMIRLNGSITNPDEHFIQNVRWHQIAGPEAHILAPYELTTGILLPNVEQIERLTFRLSASDEDRYVASDTVTVTVQPLNSALRVEGSAQSNSAPELTFKVRLLQPAPEALVLNFATADASAEAGMDYVAATGSLTLMPGEQEKTVAVELLDDLIRNGDEVFTLRVSGEVGSETVTAVGTAIIIDETGEIVPPAKPVATPIDRSQNDLGGSPGTVRVHLTWSNDAVNLNLHVTDPCGNTIYAGNPADLCQGLTGQLDLRDDGSALETGTENIVWPEGAPEGEYAVTVEHFSGIPTPYTVYIYHGNQTRMFTGVAGNGNIDPIYAFAHDPLIQLDPITSVDGMVTVSGTVSATDFDSLTIRINGNNAIDLLGNLDGNRFAVTLPAFELVSGENTIEVSISRDGTTTDTIISRLSHANPIAIAVTTPAEEAQLSGLVNVAGTVITESAELSQLQATVNGEQTVELFGSLTDNTFAFALTAQDLIEGSNRIEITATDVSGISNSALVQFSYTLPTAPEVAIQPLDTAIVNADITLSGTLTLPQGTLESLMAVINKAHEIDLAPLLSEGGFAFSVPAEWMQMGTNTVDVIATTDLTAVGSASTSFTYELPPLDLTITHPMAAGAVSSNVAVLGTLHATGEVATLDALVNGQRLIDLLGSLQNQQFALTLTGEDLLLGTNTVSISASDLDGNTASTEIQFDYDPTIAPQAGGDLVIINDLKAFDSTYYTAAAPNADNAKLVSNLVNYTNPIYPRAQAGQVLFDLSHTSACANDAPLCTESLTAFEAAMTNAGLIVQTHTATMALTRIPAEVKVIVVWLPQASFTADETAVLKQFAREGGRIVLVGEEADVYPPVFQNQLLAMLGTSVRNLGGNAAQQALVPAATPVHQMTQDIQSVATDGAGMLFTGIDDYALLATETNETIAAVSTVNLNSTEPSFNAPSIASTSPADGTTVEDSFRVTGHIELGDGVITSAQLQLNGQNFDVPLSDISGNRVTYDYAVSRTYLVDGQNPIRVSATDANGMTARVGLSVSYSLPVEPVVTIASPTDMDSVSGEGITVAGNTVLDARTTAASLELTVNGNTPINLLPFYTNNSFSTFVPYDQLVNGENTISIKIIDGNGLSSNAVSRVTFTEDFTPHITNVEPASGTVLPVESDLTIKGHVEIVSFATLKSISVSASLNGAAITPSSYGWSSTGDFNVNIPAGRLTAGTLTVDLTATDSQGLQATSQVVYELVSSI